MTFDSIVKEVEEIWADKGFVKEINGLEDKISSGSTGSEIVMNVGHFFKELKKTNEVAFTIVQKQIKEYFKLCQESGIYFTF